MEKCPLPVIAHLTYLKEESSRFLQNVCKEMKSEIWSEKMRLDKEKERKRLEMNIDPHTIRLARHINGESVRAAQGRKRSDKDVKINILR